MNDTKSKAIPVGVKDFIELSSTPFYVDKTLFLKKVIDFKYRVTVFTRPDGFGKSTLMSMVKTFFEKTDRDTSIYFRNKKIWQCGEEYTSKQGKYPVIYLDFKNIRGKSWDETLEMFRTLFRQEYRRHIKLAKLKSSGNFSRQCIERMLAEPASQALHEIFIKNLGSLLTDIYGIEPVVIIDSYDTPLKAGATYGYYREVMYFMQNLLSAGLKGIFAHSSYVFVCGELPLLLEDWHGGFDNYIPQTIADNEYGDSFGFTVEEAMDLLTCRGFEDRFDEIRDWYGGYRSCDTEIFNMQSVLCYIASGGVAKVYIQDEFTSICLKELMGSENPFFIEQTAKLIDHEKICVTSSRFSLDEGYEILDYVFPVMTHSGYLTIFEKSCCYDTWEVTVPNKETYEILSFCRNARIPKRSI
ncbi:MAG: AAA family ATPase [Clostridia bacterium]|nr:AAA family ATPase [Clostridia bacterium]